MKRGTPRHPKTYALAESLSIPLPHAVGILEMLWHHAAIHTPRGDIGSLPDVAIAYACCYRKPSILIAALVSTRWLDKDPDHRLIIHDWPRHCEESVKKWLSRNDKEMLPVYGKCLDIVETLTEQCPPSREAKAEAKAVLDKTNSESSLLADSRQDWFAAFWAAYWRRIGRGAAEKSFAAAVKSRQDFERVMQAIALQAPWMIQRDSDKRPYPATWLNQKRWEDDADVYSANGNRKLSHAERIDKAFEEIDNENRLRKAH